MPILNIVSSVTGLAGVAPRIVYILTNDTLAQVTTAGYLNNAVQNGASFNDTDMALVTTKTSPSASTTSVAWLEITKSGADWSLIPTGSPGSVTLPTIANHIATYTNTTGNLSEDAATAINGGNIQAGLSGTAGTLASFPATAANGSLIIEALAAGGAFDTTIRNSTMGQSTVYSLGDIGAATGGIPVATAAIRVKSVAAAAAAGGAAAQSFSDAFCTSGSVVVGNWVTQANAASVLTIAPGNGSFIVTSTANAGVGTFSYIITK